MKQEEYEGWITIAKFGTDYEADILRDRLDDAGFSAVVLTQRDHAFNLMFGELSTVRVMVPPDEVDTVKAFLVSVPSTDAELEQAAMKAQPEVPSVDDDSRKTLFDSGSESIRFEIPEEENDGDA